MTMPHIIYSTDHAAVILYSSIIILPLLVYYMSTGDIELSDLLTELHDVVGWFLLGIHLGIPLPDLQKIRHQFGDSVDECKTEMLITYSKLKEPEWSDIVEALKRSGEQALALRIAQKYGKN